MTKFEEEFKALTSWDWVNVDLIQKILTKFGNWHSDEEFQELKEEYSNQADSILLMLEEIANLKSQLQQQALPVVPECVADYISELKEKGHGITFGLMCSTHDATGEGNEKAIHWKDDNKETFARAWLDGYTVEKPQLFYLCEKNTGYYLRKSGTDWYTITCHYSNDYDENYMNYKFTQKEIDKLDTGSYDIVPVEDGE